MSSCLDRDIFDSILMLVYSADSSQVELLRTAGSSGYFGCLRKDYSMLKETYCLRFPAASVGART